ncbi:MAG: hypothetical protein JO224_08845 [Pelomonas sp.]|nr:hypothetical protein [Roseateles sp.]
MKFKTLASAAVGAAALVLGAAPAGQLGFATASAQADAVRPEVGKPLKDASALIKAGKYKDALGKIQEASGVAGRTAGENYMIEYMRFSAAQGAGDGDTMAHAFDALKGLGRLGAPQQLQFMYAIAGTYSRANDNAKAGTWADRYVKEGGTDPGAKAILTRSQFLSGDMTTIIKNTTDEINADVKAGRAPSMDKLNLLLAAADKKGDGNAQAFAVEQMLNFYPSPKLWAQVLDQTTRKKGFSDRFNLDVLRLRLATGNMRGVDDYMELAQLAAAAGFPEEGKVVVEKGISAGVLGQGDQGARHKRLLDLMVKKIGEAKASQAADEKAAKDAPQGDAQVNLGLAEVMRGQGAQGVQLIKDGIDKGNLKHPEDAKLYLGLAQYLAGNASAAQATWRTVKGSDGSADLAHLWILQSRKK